MSRKPQPPPAGAVRVAPAPRRSPALVVGVVATLVVALGVGMLVLVRQSTGQRTATQDLAVPAQSSHEPQHPSFVDPPAARPSAPVPARVPPPLPTATPDTTNPDTPPPPALPSSDPAHRLPPPPVRTIEEQADELKAMEQKLHPTLKTPLGGLGGRKRAREPQPPGVAQPLAGDPEAPTRR